MPSVRRTLRCPPRRGAARRARRQAFGVGAVELHEPGASPRRTAGPTPRSIRASPRCSSRGRRREAEPAARLGIVEAGAGRVRLSRRRHRRCRPERPRRRCCGRRARRAATAAPRCRGAVADDDDRRRGSRRLRDRRRRGSGRPRRRRVRRAWSNRVQRAPASSLARRRRPGRRRSGPTAGATRHPTAISRAAYRAASAARDDEPSVTRAAAPSGVQACFTMPSCSS